MGINSDVQFQSSLQKNLMDRIFIYFQCDFHFLQFINHTVLKFEFIFTIVMVAEALKPSSVYSNGL